LAPAAAWVAVTGEFSWAPLFWILAVMFWTGGFDILYALQDEEFDRTNKLHSIPARFGRKTAIWISRTFHLLTVAFLILAGLRVEAGAAYFMGCAFAAGLLLYEQSLVRENDITKINFAFFTLFFLADILLR
jgi:4-hydroxybenzoate polyprenyltransferase